MIPQTTQTQTHFEAMTEADLDAVLRVEQSAYAHPWVRQHFTDALRAGYYAQRLLASRTLLGYWVAMKGVDEVHLLNLTVAPEHQRQGWARVMLNALTQWTRSLSMEWLWLEVRLSNQRAIYVYEQHGFVRIGQRKDYYPSPHGQRESALVMRLQV